MDIFSAIDTSTSGLSAQRIRINVLSGNLANINTTRSQDGGPYKRRDPVFAAEALDDSFNNILDMNLANGIQKVKISEISLDQKDPKLVYSPSHPDADENGFIKMPNINLMEELVNIMSASRAYEANVTALNASKSMLVRALSIGGGE